MSYLTLKTIHLFFAISWFAGIFYLPRIFVNLASTDDEKAYDLLVGMSFRLLRFTRKLSLFTLFFGLTLAWYLNAWLDKWFLAKLFFIILLYIYQGFMVYFHKQFEQKKNTKSHVFFRFFNEIPVFILLGILTCVLFKNGLWA